MQQIAWVTNDVVQRSDPRYGPELLCWGYATNVTNKNRPIAYCTGRDRQNVTAWRSAAWNSDVLLSVGGTCDPILRQRGARDGRIPFAVIQFAHAKIVKTCWLHTVLVSAAPHWADFSLRLRINNIKIQKTPSRPIFQKSNFKLLRFRLCTRKAQHEIRLQLEVANFCLIDSI